MAMSIKKIIRAFYEFFYELFLYNLSHRAN